MKNSKIIIPLAALSLVIGCYFLFFFDRKDDSDVPKENSLEAQEALEAKSAAEKRRNTLEMEAAHPQDYVKLEVDPKKNLFGETVIEGNILNASKLTTYRDFELMIHWNDDAGMPLDSAVEVVLERLDPGENVDFKTKRRGPRKSRSTTLTLRAAKASAQ